MYGFLTFQVFKAGTLDQGCLEGWEICAFTQDPTRTPRLVSCSALTILNIIIIFGQWLHIFPLHCPVNYVAGPAPDILLWGQFILCLSAKQSLKSVGALIIDSFKPLRNCGVWNPGYCSTEDLLQPVLGVPLSASSPQPLNSSINQLGW